MTTACDLGYRDELVKLTPSLRRLARALVRDNNADLADDLVQATLVKALGVGKERRGLRLRLWLIASLLEGQRAASRQVSADTKVGARAGGGGTDRRGEAWEPARPSGPPPFALFASIPAECREVLLLVVLEGLSYAETAETLGLSLNVVIGRLAEARAHMTRHTRDAKPVHRLASGPPGKRSAAPHLRVVK